MGDDVLRERPARHGNSQEHMTRSSVALSPLSEVGCQCPRNARKQGQFSDYASLLPSHPEHAVSPIDVVQHQMRDLSTTHPIGSHHQKYGIVATPKCVMAIYRTQDPAHI